MNKRLLSRAIFWAANRKADFLPWTSSNVNVECARYPNHKKLIVINNTGEKQETEVFGADKKPRKMSLAAHDIQIMDVP